MATVDIDVRPERLAAGLEELRRSVEALEARFEERRRIILETEGVAPFLGQPVRLLSRVTDARGRPRPGVEVTFVTSWGKLLTSEGYTLREGSAVSARTFPDGTARVTLLPAGDEQLSKGQAQALHAGLSVLDAQAARPRDTEFGFKAMARQYSWEASFLFRQAVDVVFQQFRDGSKQRVNHRDALREWPEVGVTVVAYVADNAETGGAVEATAVVSLSLKNWLDAWLEVFERTSEETDPLATELEQAKQAGTGPSVLLEGVFGRVESFVSRQRGIVGESVGQRVAQTTLRRFATTGIEDFSSNDRRQLFSGLDSASRTVGRAGVAVLAGVGQARSEVRQELENKINAIEMDQVLGLPERLGGLDGDLAQKADTTALTSLEENVVQGLAVKTDRTDFDRFQGEIGEQLAAKVELTEHDRFQDEVDQRLTAKVEQAEQDFFRGEVDQRLVAKVEQTEHDRFRGEVDQRLTAKVDQVAFTTALAEKTDVETFQEFQRAVEDELTARVNQVAFDAALAAKVDADTFQDFQRTVERQLTTRISQVAFNTALAAKVDANTFQDFQRTVERELTTRISQVAFDAALAAKIDADTFQEFQRNVEDELATRVSRSDFDTALDLKIDADVLREPES